MKLYDLPRPSRIQLPNGEASDGSRYITFCSIDGMYSKCVTEKGALCLIAAWTELEKNAKGDWQLAVPKG